VINIGRSQPQSVVLLLQQLQQLLGVQGRVTYNVAGAGSAEVWVTWADASAAEQQLGVTATTSLSEGLQEFVDWYLSDPEWRQLL
jgi:nucleoside-diphosphate-sugar epimerase